MPFWFKIQLWIACTSPPRSTTALAVCSVACTLACRYGGAHCQPPARGCGLCDAKYHWRDVPSSGLYPGASGPRRGTAALVPYRGVCHGAAAVAVRRITIRVPCTVHVTVPCYTLPEQLSSHTITHSTPRCGGAGVRTYLASIVSPPGRQLPSSVRAAGRAGATGAAACQ